MNKSFVISKVEVKEFIKPNGGHVINLLFDGNDLGYTTCEMELRMRFKWLQNIHISKFADILVGKLYIIHISDAEFKAAEIFFAALSQLNMAYSLGQISHKEKLMAEGIINAVANPIVELIRDELLSGEYVSMTNLSISQQN